MASERKTTLNHDNIRRWAEERGGVPVAVKNTLAGDAAGVLHINFPGEDDRNYQEITWEEFFKTFSRQNLAFVYEETASDGNLSHAHEIVAHDTGESVRV